MPKRTIDDVDVAGRRVLMRVDFNVPLDAGGVITDDRRIRAALPSIRSVVDRGGRLVLMSHLGRPKGIGPEPGLSLGPAADRLRELLGPMKDGGIVHFSEGECTGPDVAAAVAALRDGETLVLDNLRFDPGEREVDEEFATRLAAYADVYCNDAFGTAHRNDASMVAVPRAMCGPRVCGLLLAKELKYLAQTLEGAKARGGFVAVLGGVKVADKLGAIENLSGLVDHILVGGAMAYTFAKTQGTPVGASLVEEDMLDQAAAILAACGPTLVLPHDHTCGRAIEPGTPVAVCDGGIDDGWMGLDIGPGSASAFARIVREAKTVVWNGPMGVFEMPPFEAGTRTVAEALVAATANGAVTVVGGGDTAAAIEAFGLADEVSHVSTGGGASLQMLEGRALASVDLLDEA